MRVARDHELSAAILGEPRVDVVQIEPIDLAVDLERDAGSGRRVEDGLDVEGIGLAPKQTPAGGVAEDVDVGVLDRPQQPVGHLLAILVESGVHRRDDEIERGEAVVGEVERAVRPDVALDAGKQPDAVPVASSARIRAACASARLSSRPLAMASDLAVIGDRDVLEAGLAGPPRPSLAMSSFPSVSVVCMCRSPRRSARSIEPRQRSCRGRLDFAAILPQLGRDPRRPSAS